MQTACHRDDVARPRRQTKLRAGSIAPITTLLVAFLVSFLLTAAVAVVTESTLATTGAGLLIVVAIVAPGGD